MSKLEGPLIDPQIERLEALLRSVSTIIKRRGRDILTDFDLTPPQLDALLTLRHFGQLTMGELCQKLFMACSTATDLIDRMEQSGLIERVRDQNDRRVVRLKVLEKGHALYEEILDARRRYLASVLEELSSEEKDVLITSLTRVNELMAPKVN